MSSRLDQALDEVIKDRRNERSGHSRRNTNNNNDRFIRRDNGGGIRKRLGNSNTQTIRSFVRTVNVQPSDRRAGRNVNSPWSHDMFDDDNDYGRNSIISRLGNARSSSSGQRNTQVEITIENLHYNVTENDVRELFNTVADVVKCRLIFDISGRSTGVAMVRYNSKEDAEQAIKKYNNIELDGQAMKIEIKERAPRTGHNDRRRHDSRGGNRGRFNNDRHDRNSRNNGDNNSSRRSTRNDRGDRQKKALTAEELDKEMENYMKSNSNNDTINEDTDMMLD